MIFLSLSGLSAYLLQLLHTLFPFTHSIGKLFLSDAYFVKFCSVLPSIVLISSSIAAMSVSISFTRRSLSSTIFSSFLRCFCNCFSARSSGGFRLQAWVCRPQGCSWL